MEVGSDGRPSILRNKMGKFVTPTPKSVGITMLDNFPNREPRYKLSE